MEITYTIEENNKTIKQMADDLQTANPLLDVRFKK